jgi:hypothetical protein
MPLDQATLKRQLEHVTEDLAEWISALDSRGVTAADRRKDAKWRHLNAESNAIRRRIKRVADIKTRDEDAAKRKAEKLTAVVPEKETKAKPKKASKPVKEKAEKADKHKGGEKSGEKKSEGKEKKKKD